MCVGAAVVATVVTVAGAVVVDHFLLFFIHPSAGKCLTISIISHGGHILQGCIR